MPDASQNYVTRGTVTEVRTLDEMRAAADAGTDESAESLLALAESRALNKRAFEQYPPVFFTVDASTDIIDAYSTYMLPSTLTNFAADAAEGRSVLDSHNSFENGFGRSLTGTVTSKDVPDHGKAKVMRSSFFAIRNYTHKGFDSNSLIAGIETGQHTDISVGFSIPEDQGAAMVCSICGENMLDWERCRHFPGLKYEIENATNKDQIDRVRAIGAIDKGRLNEYSLVYDGATPGAAVVKAIEMIDAGELDRGTIDRLERAYRRAFPKSSRSVATVPDLSRITSKEEHTDMELRDRILALANDTGIRLRTGVDDEGLVAALSTQLTGLATDRANAETERDTANAARIEAERKLTESTHLIEDGRKYREALVQDCVDAEKRSLPETALSTYREDVVKRYLNNMEVDDILALTSQHEARSLFQPGTGSSPSGTANPNPATQRRVPMRVHADN